jgi:carbon storage regulator CsrA
MSRIVITRRLGEAVCIAPDVTVRVVALEHGKCRLAIEAPRELRISRDPHRVPKEEL